jgi:hypothetical protein
MPPTQNASSGSAVAVETKTAPREARLSPELEAELLEAMSEIERGDCLELTPEQLERCIVDGEWPWPDEFRG